ncbi:MAG: peptidase M23, partial [Gammaproteobacteria bacterium]|nr:peptidase M23 [Gammaproteobacteria bacterium]
MAASLKPSLKNLPFVVMAILGAIAIYDAGITKEEAVPEIVSETLLLSPKNEQGFNTKNIHIVKEGENLSVIFEKYKVSLNDTYKIFRKDKSGEVKNILPKDRLVFSSLNNILQKITIYKGSLLSFEIEILPEIRIKKNIRKPELINSFKTGVIESS